MGETKQDASILFGYVQPHNNVEIVPDDLSYLTRYFRFGLLLLG